MKITLQSSFRFLGLFLIVACISLAAASPALAIPAMPSSFYGTIKLNNANVPDGTVIRAVINGQVFAQGLSQTYQGDSVYTLDVPGDNTDTSAIDGGHDGDTVHFEIGGIPAAQTGVWHSGTNTQVNISASSANTPLPPQPSLTAMPTQTRISTLPPTQSPYTPRPTSTQFVPTLGSTGTSTTPMIPTTDLDVVTVQPPQGKLAELTLSSITLTNTQVPPTVTPEQGLTTTIPADPLEIIGYIVMGILVIALFIVLFWRRKSSTEDK